MPVRLLSARSALRCVLHAGGVDVKPKRCPICISCVCTIRQPRRTKKPKPRAVISVSAKAHRWMKAAAEARNTSITALVEAAMEGVLL